MPSRQDDRALVVRDYGEPVKFDPNFKGPLKHRSCTDVICLLLFILFLIGWSIVAFYGYQNGNLNRLIMPTDSNNNRCGVDSNVLNKPYLFFFDLSRCVDITTPINGCPTPQVCVEKCPDQAFLFDMVSESESIDNLRKLLICDNSVNKNDIKSYVMAKEYVNNNQCARWYLQSVPFYGRCIPFDFQNVNQILETIALELQNLIQAVDHIKILATINGIGQMVVEDIIDSWITILVSLGITMIISLLFIMVMRWIAAPVIWCTILGVIGILGFVIYYSLSMYIHLNNNPVYNSAAGSNINAIVKSYLDNKNTWLCILIAVSIILLITLLLILVLRKRIVIAIALVKEGSKAVSSTTSTIFFPIFPWILYLLVIAFSITVGLYLASVGDPLYRVVGLNNSTVEGCQCTGPPESIYENGDYCNPELFYQYCREPITSSFSKQAITSCRTASCHFQRIDSPKLVGYFHGINIIGFFWLLFFISAFNEMVLASAFSTWYWTFHKTDVPFFNITISMGRTIRYHLGTLAFGSLIITICRIIRCILEYIDHKLKKFDNEVTRAILCCCKCFFWCLEKFLKFLNRNAYIMCAIHGKNFCSSAQDAFNLLMRNFLRVITLDKVTDFLFFMAKVLISTGMAVASHFFLKSPHSNLDLNYSFIPVVIVAIGSYLIGSIFFSVYSMAVDTLFLCFLEDTERNDGTPEKPYFMSKELMKILGKKNEVPRHRYN
uniref:Choline transporter-like protein n=2 Tax=Nyssomyia neivai TaxID=330878 RepID=A0A1L8DEG2_9DIPT